nr:hypothetical protein [Tanacetum cinerariifolium]
MGRDTVQLETVVNTISQEYLLEFTSEYDIPETLHPELPGPEDRIVDFPKGKVGKTRFFWVDERVFPTVVDWRTNAPKDGMPTENTYSVEAMRALDTHRTPIQKQSEMLPCLVGISRRYYLGDEVHRTDYRPLIADIDLFNLIRASNPTKGAAAPEVPLPEDVPAASAPEVGQAEEVATTDPSVATENRKRGRDGADVNAISKVLRRDHADHRPTGSTHGGKSLAAIELGLASTHPVPAPKNAPTGVSDPYPLSFADPRSCHLADVAQSSQGTAAAGDSESRNASFAFAVGYPESYFFVLRHMDNDDFLRQYNVNLARQVAMGSQLRLRFEQEAKLLRKSVAQVARQDKRIQAQELEIKNLEALLEAETDIKKAAEDRSAGLSQELEDMRARFIDLQVSNQRLSQQRCAEMDARLDALSIDFDEELYPQMLTAIVGHRWVIGRGLRLTVMKCGESLELRQAFVDVMSVGVAKGMSEGLRHGVEHRQAQLSLESIEAYDPEAEAKYVAALQVLKDLKYPLVDQLEGLKDRPMDVIMAAMYLESDTGDDTPQHIRDLRPSSSQLTIPVYPEVRDPMNPWAYKEEMLLADAIAANISRAEKKKKCRIVCRTHGVGSAHHSRSDGVPVSVPTVVP